MYARYIPPSKGPAAAGELAAAAPSPMRAEAPAQTAVSVKAPADGFSYARYVPGDKPAGKPQSTGTIQYFNDELSPPKPKRKRETADEPSEPRQSGSKKSKTRGEQSGVRQVAAQDDGKQETDTKTKKNRRKRKQRTRADSDSEDSGDEVPRPEHIPPKSPRVEAPEPRVAVTGESKPETTKRKEKSEHRRSEAQHVGKMPESKDGDVAMADANKAAEDTDAVSVPKSAGIKEKKRMKEKGKKRTEKAQAPGHALEREQGDDLRHKAILERKTKSLKLASETAQVANPESDAESTELHGLEPLPQPAMVADDESKPTYNTLPPWLANPIRVSQDTRAPFKDLGILPRPARILEQKGFSEAFAVQTAAIPLLLPTSKHRPGDVLISAATGSGKTLAYALPIVRDINQGLVTRLRALVVLPTRELVKQAQEVFEICARAYDSDERKRVRIGVAVGSQSIKSEQQMLMESESRYDAEAYKELEEQDRQRRAQKAASADMDDVLDLGAGDRDARLGTWEGEVVDFSSKVDVLICTPGRLVEHIVQTPGFSLDYVRWLVVDEADKILAQSFQGWLDLVMDKFRATTFSAREFPDMEYSGPRKVILSATLTRDLSLLNQLSLRRPRLIVLEHEGTAQIAEHSLPASLREFAVRVHDTSLKPLYLLDLLRGRHMNHGLAGGDKTMLSKPTNSGSETSSSDSDSPETASDSDSSSDSDGEASASAPQAPQLPHCLVFTKSNESALRLARLLALLDESLSAHMSTLTSTTPTHLRRKTLRAFATASSPIRLIIASDLVARGIDVPKLEHVVNYDLPASVAGYVHRVGRTARAGRSGCAWTLVGDEESGWFWGKIVKGQGVRRAHKVERTRIEEMGEERVKEYEDALAKLGKEALEMRRR